MPLSLRRKIGEDLVLGESIRIRVGRIEMFDGRPSSVRLHISAPQEVTIRRGEVPPRSPEQEPSK